MLTCLPDGGVTGSEFASVRGFLMNAGVSRVDKIVVRLSWLCEAGGTGCVSTPPLWKSKLRGHFALMNLSFFLDRIVMRNTLMFICTALISNVTFFFKTYYILLHTLRVTLPINYLISLFPHSSFCSHTSRAAPQRTMHH